MTAPRPTRRPTIRDVAHLAEVSPSTVSRVLNGERVKPELVKRVSAAVDTLGYRRNVGATSLRRLDAASATIGVILEDVSNPFFAAIHRGVEDVARERSVITLAGSSDEDPSLERGLAEAFLARRVDGLVMVPALGAHDHSYLFRDIQAGRPVVFVDRLPRFVDADAVLSDNVGGARTGVAHLASSGHRRVAFLGDHEELFTAQQRLRGYREAVAHHGLDEDPRLIRHLGFRAAGVRTATHELLQRSCPATALFTAQNLVTSGALCVLHEERRQHDVALVGFDELPLDGLLSPPVAVVVQDPYAMGRTAAELLFSRLDGYRGPSRRCVHPTRLVARSSGSIPPPA